MYENRFKRPFDFVASLIGLCLLAPLLLLIGVAIRMDTPGAVLYRQQRVGKGGRNFQILKFRSMLPLEHSLLPNGDVMPNEMRVTRVGRVLRTFSLDELPQLVNVVLGDMSLVGPRPTLPYQVERYTDWQKQRLQVRPGLTGLAQVTGRNDLTWEEKIELDIKYLQKITLYKDILIMRRTIGVVFKGEGIQFKKPDPLSAHKTDYWKDI